MTFTALEKKKYDEFYDLHRDENKATTHYLRWKCETDLYFLGSVIFGLRDVRDRKTGRKRLDPRVHKEMAALLQTEEDTLMLYPRGTLKTEWTKIKVIQNMLREPSSRQAIWSRTAGLVRKELKSIKAKFSNPQLKELYPDVIPENPKKYAKDTASELTLIKLEEMDEWDSGQSQIEVWGIEATVTGHHYDYHFYDDVINEDSVTTPEQIEKVESWWQHVQAIREMSATEKMIGTRYHHADIYGTIIREEWFPKATTRKAIVAGKSYYAFYTMPYLRKLRKRMGNWVFSCQYMNEPTPDEDKLFMAPYPVWKKLPEDPLWYMAVDPSLGKRYSDRTGIAIGCIDRDKHDKVYYQECYGVKMKPHKLAEEIVRKIIQYRPRRVGIEYGLQEALQYLIDIKITGWEDENSTRIRPEFFPISTGKTKKAYKIGRTIAAFTRDGRAEFRPGMKDLFHQMDFYNPMSDKNDDDILDAAGMLIQTIEYFAKHFFERKNELPKVKGYTLLDLMKVEKKVGWAAAFST